jgi:bisanhydrobacterioruberin hydratase
MLGKTERILYYILGAMYVAGILGLALPSVRPLFQLFTPFHLLTVAYFVFYKNLKAKEIFYYIFIISILGYAIEVLGVATGLIFGEYAYGHALGPKVLAVPPMIGVNWLIMMYCTSIFVLKFMAEKTNKISISLAIAALMTLFDILVEPVAIKLEMWSWAAGTPPIQNYVAWFIISFVFSFFTLDLIKNNSNPKAIFIYALQWIFFSILFLVL